MEYFIKALKQYADFNGRSTRKEYWMFYLFYFIFYIVLTVVDTVIGAPVFSTIFALGLFVPTISVGARRLHDTGRSGWWQLILLVPLIGAIVLIVFFVKDSHDDNKFGPNPKAVGGV
ncbi:DUF805 domain-containing protein [Oceanospirillum maris]|uniref:DUF805 domain-containing protein n=1 Tax=Oceanospirillum maris TaxID=64977 RepID=UPI000420C4A1|nr:DUF805 domain-containing protein [Oceanospirillum maris]